VKTVSGSYAEFSVADECHTFRLHDDLTFSQGAALGIPYFTAYRALVLIVHGPDRISVPRILSNLTVFFQEIYACR